MGLQILSPPKIALSLAVSVSLILSILAYIDIKEFSLDFLPSMLISAQGVNACVNVYLPGLHSS